MRKITFFVLLMTFVITFCLCSDDSDSTSSLEINLDIFTAAKEVGPVITDSRIKNKATWESGGTLYTIYTLIKDYINNGDTMSQGVDGSNMYVVMADAQDGVERALESCSSITPQTISTVFDFGSETINNSIQYDCAYTGTSTSGSINYINSYGVLEDGIDYYMNMGWYADEGTQQTPHSMEFHWNETDQTLEINSAYLVSYSDNSTYNVRMYLSGDVDTNIFTLKLLKGGKQTDGSQGTTISIVGYGVSEDGYFLFKVNHDQNGDGDCTDTNETNGKYYCFSSECTDTDLQAMDDAGHDKTESEITTNCSEYIEYVDAITMYVQSDAAETESEFNGAGSSGGQALVQLDYSSE